MRLLTFTLLATANALVTPGSSGRLLVCGGSGFLGREVCREAVARGWAVTSLSRRGTNPEPGSTLDGVNWIAGDVSDAELLSTLAADADAFVHSIGLLLDAESGLGGLNFITSGSRSVPADGATYDSVMRKSADALLSAVSQTKGGAERPLVYVSAAEAAWEDSDRGRSALAALPEFLQRYLVAKREAESLLLAGEAAAGVRVVSARPSLMYDYTKLDVLPLVPLINPAVGLGVGGGLLSKMLRVHVVGAAVVAALEGSEVRGSLQPAALEVRRRQRPAASIVQSLTRRARRRRGARPPLCHRPTADLDALSSLSHAPIAAAGARAALGGAQSGSARHRHLRLRVDRPPPFRLHSWVNVPSTLFEDVAPSGPLPAWKRAVASAARLGSLRRRGRLTSLRPPGTTVAEELQGEAPPVARPPAASLRLYEFEACPFCRRVREAISYLDLEVTVVPCGQGSRHREHVVAAAAKAGRAKPSFPYLEDDAAGVRLFESEDIVNHLLEVRAARTPTPLSTARSQQHGRGQHVDILHPTTTTTTSHSSPASATATAPRCRRHPATSCLRRFSPAGCRACCGPAAAPPSTRARPQLTPHSR